SCAPPLGDQRGRAERPLATDAVRGAWAAPLSVDGCRGSERRRKGAILPSWRTHAPLGDVQRLDASPPLAERNHRHDFLPPRSACVAGDFPVPSVTLIRVRMRNQTPRRQKKRLGRPPRTEAVSHDEIIDAVYRLMKEKPLDDVSMDEIARSA